MCVINHHGMASDPLIAFILFLKKSTISFTLLVQSEHFHCLKSWSFVADHMFLKSICSVLMLPREGGRKLWKGFNLLRGGSCAVNTPATSSLGRCQVFLQPRLYEGGAGGEEDETPQMLSLGPLYLAARCQEDKLW